MQKKSLIFIVLLVIYSVIFGNTKLLAAHGRLYQDEMNLIHRDRKFIPPTESHHDFQNYRNYIQFLKVADQMQDVNLFDRDQKRELTKNLCQQKVMVLLKDCYVLQRYAFYTNIVYIMNENHSVQQCFLRKKNIPDTEIIKTILTKGHAIADLLHKQTPGDRYQIAKSAQHIMQALNGMQYYCALELVQFLADQTQSATDIIFGEKRCAFVDDFHGIIDMHMCHQIRKGFVGTYPEILKAAKKITERVLAITNPESRMRTIKGTCFVMKNLRAQHDLYSVPDLIDRLSQCEPYMDRFLKSVSYLFESKKPRNFLNLDHIYTLCAIDIVLLEQTVRELGDTLSQFPPDEYSTIIYSVHKKDPREIKSIVNYSFYISNILNSLFDRNFCYTFIVDQLSRYDLYLSLVDRIRDRIAEYKSDCCHLVSWIMPGYVEKKRNQLRYDLYQLLKPVFPAIKLYH